MQVLYTARFLRSFNKLPNAVQRDVEKAIVQFGKSPKHTSLRLHKLSGRMKKYHAFSANYNHRVVVKLNKHNAYCMDVGDYSVYK